ncbi:MAG: hypothetical protein IJ228_02335 [Succinivibrio sp.]|nr:hypothetical protein [Succinivibrio sp.]
MYDLIFRHQLHQFLARRGHILEDLSERNYREAMPSRFCTISSTPRRPKALFRMLNLRQAAQRTFQCIRNETSSPQLSSKTLPLRLVVVDMVAVDTKVNPLLSVVNPGVALGISTLKRNFWHFAYLH